MGKCIIVGAGEFGQIYETIKAGDYIIAADGGYVYLQQSEIIPDLVIGDMDSITDKEWNRKVQEYNIKTVCLPIKKDDTDMLAAIKEGLSLGYTDFSIYGGLGGRIDHTIANIQCLEYLQKHGARGIIYGRNDCIELICNEKKTYNSDCTGTISVFAFGGEAFGVTEKGLMYELEDAVLTTDIPIGVSNEFIGKESMIEVRQGMLLICRQSAV